MTIVTSADLVPELQHWFYIFVVNSIVNRYGVPAPADVDSNCVNYLTQDSFIELLFNENYDGTVYHYLYTADTSKTNWTYGVMTRLNLYPGAATYYRLSQSDSGQNVFNLQSSDLTMLDALLAYRTDGTAVSIFTIDSTSSLTFDSTSLVLYANYNSLPTELSKLIYLLTSTFDIAFFNAASITSPISKERLIFLPVSSFSRYTLISSITLAATSDS